MRLFVYNMKRLDKSPMTFQNPAHIPRIGEEIDFNEDMRITVKRVIYDFSADCIEIRGE